MKERENYIDYLRALGIILMVLAHIPIDKKVVHIIHSFHMPLFFVISGYFMSKKDCNHLKKTIKKMLIPYLFFAALGYILWFIEINPKTITEILTPIKSIFWINSYGMPIAGALWFLTAMIFVNIFVFCIESLKNTKIKKIIIIMLFLLGLFETKIFTYRLPWSIGAACTGVGFFYVGVLIKKYLQFEWMKKVKNISLGWYAIVIIILGISIYFNETLNMRLGNYGCIWQSILNSVLAIFILWICVERITPFLELKLNKVISNEIKSVGQYSIVYLCCNEMIINIVKSILNKININNIYFTIILVIIGLKICEKIFTKTFMKKIVGIK